MSTTTLWISSTKKNPKIELGLLGAYRVLLDPHLFIGMFVSLPDCRPPAPALTVWRMLGAANAESGNPPAYTCRS